MLSARVRDGDRVAVADLVRELTPLLWNTARAQGVNRQTAEDAVQFAWLTLLRSAATVREPEAMTSWLVTITRREAQRLSRLTAREPVYDPAALPDPPSDELLPEGQVGARERRARLRQAIEQLSPRCRELVRVVAFADRPDYAAVSRALGMPLGSIGPTRGRCLAKLRQLLAADPHWSRDA
jgi:RNA polymerase sigma factor (sigma-70 family)